MDKKPKVDWITPVLILAMCLVICVLFLALSGCTHPVTVYPLYPF